MNRRVCVRRAAGMLVAIGLATVAPLIGGPTTPTASAMSCFTVADQMSCIDATVWVPVAPVVPRVIVPIGPGFEGENEHTVIRDDGGRHVARG